jgi:hypothetical protein
MPFNYEPTMGRATGTLGWSARIMNLSRIFGAILCFALLNHPAPASGATGPGQYSVTMKWERSSSPEVTGYHIYFGTASGDYTDSVVVGDVTTNTISGLTDGVTYFFAATAMDTNGAESSFSNEFSFMPGVPTVQLRAAPAGQFVLTVSGLIGRAYDILATQDFSAWAVIGTVTLDASGSLNFTDTNAANFPRRFYRTQLKP